MIVVEGKDDTVKIKQAVYADTIETNGSAIGKSVIDQIRHAKQKRGVIVFTDPDYPGERIRQMINEAVPGCKHAFLTKEKARAKHPHNKSLGIEHASVTDIKEALAKVYDVAEEHIGDIQQVDLISYGLIGGNKASVRRKWLGEYLKIGQPNGKQLLKRLNMFQITKEELDQAMQALDMEVKNES